MSTTILDEQHVASVRAQIVQLVESMLAGNICFIEGAQQLTSLRHQAAIADNDPDFLVFVGVASNTDHLPIGAPRLRWSAEALARHQAEIDTASQWARKICGEACISILERFNH